MAKSLFLSAEQATELISKVCMYKATLSTLSGNIGVNTMTVERG